MTVIFCLFVGVCISCLLNLQCSPVSDISVSHMTATTACREENLIPSIHKHHPPPPPLPPSLSLCVCECVCVPSVPLFSPPICLTANIIRGLRS